MMEVLKKYIIMNNLLFLKLENAYVKKLLLCTFIIFIFNSKLLAQCGNFECVTNENISQLLTDWFTDSGFAVQAVYGNISEWDVSNVTDMSNLFNGNGPHANFNEDISAWDVSNVTDMSYMFFNNSSFNQDIGGWDVSNVTNMAEMFHGANLLIVYLALLTS